MITYITGLFSIVIGLIGWVFYGVHPFEPLVIGLLFFILSNQEN